MMQYVEDSYYRDIAYHTAIHAADTVHGVHFFISRQVVCMYVVDVGVQKVTGDVWRLGLKAWGKLGTVGDQQEWDREQEGSCSSGRAKADMLAGDWLLWIVLGK